jgi:hypothetical protein
MFYKAKDYINEISKNENWRKCFSTPNLNKLLDFLEEQQWLPSQVTINRALAELKFRRTDGGSAESDRQAAIAVAQRNLDAVIAETDKPPLTRTELAEFASLGFAELQHRYWGNDGVNTFAVRYSKASREHGFRIPARPQVVEQIDDSKELKLSAAEYRAIPAQTVSRRMQTDPAFKRAVDRLIEAGVI